MALIAILEDDDGRREAMLGCLDGGHEVVVFPRAAAMIAFLETRLGECAVVSLDHDLLGDDPGTGMDVATFLAARAPGCPVIVHTSNYLAAPGMIYVLENAGWHAERVVPFSDLEWVAKSWGPTVLAFLGG